MTAPVPQAAVDSAMEAMGCARVPVDWDSLDFGQQTNWVTSGQPIAFGDYCFEHRHDWTDDGTCQAAREVAAAVVAAVQGPIKAEVLREAADAYLEADAATRFIVQPAKWLRNRADQIEADHA